jgi:hypothetical protein
LFPLTPDGHIPIPPGANANLIGLTQAADHMMHGMPQEQSGLKTRKDLDHAVNIVTSHGGTVRPPLTNQSITAINKVDPAIMSTDRLIQLIQNTKDDKGNPLMLNNDSGYLFVPRALYSWGHLDTQNALARSISEFSLTSLVDAVMALQGSSRAMPALQKALEHTPDVKWDSPALMLEKLLKIRARLVDVDRVARDPYAQMFATDAPVPGPYQIGQRNPKFPDYRFIGGDWQQKNNWQYAPLNFTPLQAVSDLPEQ